MLQASSKLARSSGVLCRRIRRTRHQCHNSSSGIFNKNNTNNVTTTSNRSMSSAGSGSSSTLVNAFDDKDTYFSSGSSRGGGIGGIFSSSTSSSSSLERDPVLPHKLSPTRTVPTNIIRPPYAETGQIPYSKYGSTILIHDEESIDRMRTAARLSRKILDYTFNFLRLIRWQQQPVDETTADSAAAGGTGGTGTGTGGDNTENNNGGGGGEGGGGNNDGNEINNGSAGTIPIPPLHPSTLALAFKVVHMKGRGGSGDGRVVFARVYSGKLQDKETIQVLTPPAPGEPPNAPRVSRLERIGGMLELAGGRFDNVEGGTCYSGEVCALVGLKSVVTGDTIVQPFENKGVKKKGHVKQERWLAGMGTPKPVITVRLEAESAAQQKVLSESLQLMAIEDPSLVVEETDSATLLSGLGELHIEVTLDRLSRDHGLEVMVGPPLVAYRETVKDSLISPGGLLEFDRTLGGTRLQAAVHLELRPREKNSGCILLSDPIVSLGKKCRDYLGLSNDLTEEELIQKSDLARALIQGCHGAMKRGPLKSMPLANVECRVIGVDAEGGVKALKALPGSLQAASANAVQTTLNENLDSCVVLEPAMSLEVAMPNSMVGAVLSDLNSRRGVVGDVIAGEGSRTKSLVRGDVPLVEILGNLNGLSISQWGLYTLLSTRRVTICCQLYDESKAI